MVNILVVDDDKNTRLFFKALLEREKYNVYTAQNGSEALSLMAEESIDLIVLDVMMPEINGYEFTRILRENDNMLPT